jgi:hypothetical protein
MKCKKCKKEFIKQRSTQKFCCSKCRTSFHSYGETAKKWKKKHWDQVLDYTRKSKTKKELYSTKYYIGQRAEHDALKILRGSKLDNIKQRNRSWDLIWKGKKIDVKSSRAKVPKQYKSPYWSFRASKKKISNYFLCIGYIKNKIDKVFLIPNVGQSGFQIPVTSNNSKYYKYLIN